MALLDSWQYPRVYFFKYYLFLFLFHFSLRLLTGSSVRRLLSNSARRWRLAQTAKVEKEAEKVSLQDVVDHMVLVHIFFLVAHIFSSQCSHYLSIKLHLCHFESLLTVGKLSITHYCVSELIQHSCPAVFSLFLNKIFLFFSTFTFWKEFFAVPIYSTLFKLRVSSTTLI